MSDLRGAWVDHSVKYLTFIQVMVSGPGMEPLMGTMLRAESASFFSSVPLLALPLPPACVCIIICS